VAERPVSANLASMTTDLQCRCGATFSIGRAGTSAQVCPKCKRLLYVSAPGQVSTLVPEG